MTDIAVDKLKYSTEDIKVSLRQTYKNCSNTSWNCNESYQSLDSKLSEVNKAYKDVLINLRQFPKSTGNFDDSNVAYNLKGIMETGEKLDDSRLQLNYYINNLLVKTYNHSSFFEILELIKFCAEKYIKFYKTLSEAIYNNFKGVNTLDLFNQVKLNEIKMYGLTRNHDLTSPRLSLDQLKTITHIETKKNGSTITVLFTFNIYNNTEYTL